MDLPIEILAILLSSTALTMSIYAITIVLFSNSNNKKEIKKIQEDIKRMRKSL